MTTPSTPTQRPVWFEPFLQTVKLELGYPFDIGKYKQLLTWANNNGWAGYEVRDKSVIAFKKLYAVCRILFLQNPEHEKKFESIFNNYIADELYYERTILQSGQEKKVKEGRKAGEQAGETSGVDTTITEQKDLAKSPELLQSEPLDDVQATTVSVKKYLNFTIPQVTEDKTPVPVVSASASRFLLTDAYLPLTTREMIHGWRHLRKRERSVFSNRLNVSETVKQIATNGMLLYPVFETDHVNSDDLLVIFADRRGSMTPFHTLIDKLVETAVQGGGHGQAKVFYFNNCPVDVVYKNSNLTEAIALSEVFSAMRPDHTNALIISDAGAARGHLNTTRIEQTNAFLYGNNNSAQSGLHKRALFVTWLNPMPPHRWIDSTAEHIARNTDTPMFSVMNEGYTNFLHLVQKLMGK